MDTLYMHPIQWWSADGRPQSSYSYVITSTSLTIAKGIYEYNRSIKKVQNRIETCTSRCDASITFATTEYIL